MESRCTGGSQKSSQRKTFKKTVNERRQVFISFLLLPHDVCVDLVLRRRSGSDPMKLDSELSPPSWPSCAPTLLTARSKGESWRSTASETSIWSLRWAGLRGGNKWKSQSSMKSLLQCCSSLTCLLSVSLTHLHRKHGTGPTSCCCELKSVAARKTCLCLSLSSWRTTGCRGLIPAPRCRTAARPARSARPAAPGTEATAAKPAPAAAASLDRKARDTATGRPSRSETGRGRRERHSVALPAAGCLPAEVFIWDPGGLGAPLEGGAGVRVSPTPSPKPWRPTRHPNLLVYQRRAGKHQQGCWCRRWEDRLGGHRSAETRCLWERALGAAADWTVHGDKAGAHIEPGTGQGRTSSILSFTPLLFFQGTSPASFSHLFSWPFTQFWDQTHFKNITF